MWYDWLMSDRVNFEAMYQLREYQKEAVEAAVRHFERDTKRNGVIVLPTGAGKSLVIANIAYRLESGR